MIHFSTMTGRLCNGGEPLERVTPDPRAVDCPDCLKNIHQWKAGDRMNLPSWTCSAVEPRDKTMTVVVVGGETLAYPGDYLINNGHGIIVTNPIGRVRSARG